MRLQQWWSNELQKVGFFVPGNDNYTLWEIGKQCVTAAPASTAVNKTKILFKPC